MACCPEGALGQLGTEGYKCKVYFLKKEIIPFKYLDCRERWKKLMTSNCILLGQARNVLYGIMTFSDSTPGAHGRQRTCLPRLATSWSSLTSTGAHTGSPQPLTWSSGYKRSQTGPNLKGHSRTLSCPLPGIKVKSISTLKQSCICKWFLLFRCQRVWSSWYLLGKLYGT